MDRPRRHNSQAHQNSGTSLGAEPKTGQIRTWEPPISDHLRKATIHRRQQARPSEDDLPCVPQKGSSYSGEGRLPLIARPIWPEPRVSKWA